MRSKLTRALTGVALAAVMAGGAVIASPVQAAPAQAASSDRLVGKLVLRNLVGTGSWAVKPDLTYAYFSSQSEAESVATRANIPAVGQTGPIVIDGQCLALGQQDTTSGFPVSLKSCDDVTLRDQFKVLPDGKLQNAHYSTRYLGVVSTMLGVSTAAQTGGTSYVEFIDLSRFRVPVEEVAITSPAPGSTVNTANPVFEGTGEEGAVIVVRDGEGNELCRTSVVDGQWACTAEIELLEGPNTIIVEQQVEGEDPATHEIEMFVVADDADTPLFDARMAGGLLLVGAAVVAARRRLLSS